MRTLTRYHLPMHANTLLFLATALCASAASAQQYRWVDEKGHVHYTDTPPPVTAKDVQKKNLQGNELGAQQNFQLSTAMQKSPVTLYTHTECKDPCQSARDVLNTRGIPFKEISVVTQQQLDELRRVSGNISVPVMVVGGYVETSSSIGAYNQALDIAGYPAPGIVPPRHQLPPAPTAEKPAAAQQEPAK